MKQKKRKDQDSASMQNNAAVPIKEEAEKTFVRFLKRGEPPHDYERQLLTEHFDRVIYILGGGSPPPYELEIQPSASCNLKCKHCFGRFYDPLPAVITEKEMEDLARKVADFEEDGWLPDYRYLRIITRWLFA